MKKAILGLALVLGLSSSTYAGTHNNGNRFDKDKFFKELNLSQDQQEQIRTIKADFGKQIKAVKMTRLAPEAQQVSINGLIKKQHEAMTNILNDDQKAKFSELYAKHSSEMNREKRYNGKHHGYMEQMGMLGRGGAGICMLAGIDLSDKQKEEYKQIADQHQKESKSMHDKYGEEKKKIDEKHSKAIYKLLDKDQKIKFDENKSTIEKRSENFKKGKLNIETRAQIKDLRENYKKDKTAIEMSRIAPEMQKQKLMILKDKFEKDIQSLIGGDSDLGDLDEE